MPGTSDDLLSHWSCCMKCVDHMTDSQDESFGLPKWVQAILLLDTTLILQVLPINRGVRVSVQTNRKSNLLDLQGGGVLKVEVFQGKD